MLRTSFLIQWGVILHNVDLTGDGLLDFEDVLGLLGDWGGSGSDLHNDNAVGVRDLLLMLEAWPG